jgi:hypothetical protein
MFCRWPTTPRNPKQRSRRADKVKALGAAWAEVANWRHHVSHQAKVVMSALPRVSISLEHCKMMF